MSSFGAQGFLCAMPQSRMMPAIVQMPPLKAVTHGAGFAENSVRITCQERAVHARRAFHIVMVNTSHIVSVTRKGIFMLRFGEMFEKL